MPPPKPEWIRPCDRADDYVTKPFSPPSYGPHRRPVPENRRDELNDGDLVNGPFRLNTRNRTLEKNGERIGSPNKYSIMKCLWKTRYVSVQEDI